MLITAVAALCYVAATVLILQAQRQGASQRNARDSARSLALAAVAVGAHALALFLLSEHVTGFRFGFFDAASLIGLVAATLVLAMSSRLPLRSLLPILFPFAATVAVLHLALGDRSTAPDHITPWHALPALMGFCVLTIAAVQASIMAFQERQLRHSRSLVTLRMLPPLQTMEDMLFQLLWVGLALLSVGIVTGLFVLDNMFEQRVVQHSVLSIASWIVFATLLWGRHTLGWRGRTAIRWTLVGFAFLALAYLGSKLVIEIILTR